LKDCERTPILERVRIKFWFNYFFYVPLDLQFKVLEQNLS
jgi:hypothetical protein